MKTEIFESMSPTIKETVAEEEAAEVALTEADTVEVIYLIKEPRFQIYKRNMLVYVTSLIFLALTTKSIIIIGVELDL